MSGPFGLDPHRPYNRNAYLCTHNCYSSKGRGWVYYQQNMDVYDQLKFGARCIMPDIWEDDNDIWLFHEGKTKSHLMNPTGHFQKWSDMLKDVKRFLDENPTEVVAAIHETYVTHPEWTEKALRDAGVFDMVWWADGRNGWNKDCRDQVWPTYAEIAASGRRLILYSYKYNQDGMPYEWDYMTECVYGDDGLKKGKWQQHRSNNYPLTCDKSMFILNHFPSISLNLFGFNKMGLGQNDCNNILQHVDDCKQACAAGGCFRLPNYVAVDLCDEGANGGPPAAVAKINEMWAQAPPPHCP